MLVFSTIVVVFLITFLAASIAVVVAWMVLQRRAAPAGEGLSMDDPLGSFEDSPRLLKNDLLSTISPWAELLAHFDFVPVMKTRLAESGLTWSVGRLTAMMLLCASIVLAVGLNFDWFPGW